MRRSDSLETQATRRVRIGQIEQIDEPQQILPLRTTTRRRLRQNFHPGGSKQAPPPISPHSAKLGLTAEEALRSRRQQ